MSASDPCRKHSVSDATFYKRRSKYGGLELSEAMRMKALEEENARLKKLLPESMMNVSTLREMLGKTFDARLEEECRELFDRRERLLATPRLWARRHRPSRPSLPIGTAGRCGVAQPAEGTGVATPPLRLSPPACPAEARGHLGELEEALPPLSRGTSHSSQARRPQAGLGHAGANGDLAGSQPETICRD